MFEKKCILCGDNFLNRSNNVYICNKDHIVKCNYCGKEFVLSKKQKSMIKPGNPQFNLEFFCSRQCQALGRKEQIHTKEALEKTLKTKLERYGNYNNHEKAKKTNLERYGSEYTVTSKEIQEKIENTFIEKYGSRCFCGTEEFVNKTKKTKQEKYGDENYNNSEKAKKTNLKRYGVTNPMKLKEVQEKVEKTNLKRYGKKYLMQSDKIKDLAKEKCIQKYGVEYNCLTDQCIEKQNNTISELNKLLGNMLEETGLNIEYEFKIGLKRYDLHIKNSNILLEVNPTYTHNITKRPVFKGKEVKAIPKDYHYERTKLAKENGYRCIHIWDWDNYDKIINMLPLNKEKLYARKLQIKEITKQEANEFLDKYHLQNHSRGNIVNIALVQDDNIVQLMTFGKPRYNKNYEYELLRLCTNSSYLVVGGSEKLFKYFIETYKPSSVISYCDSSKFDGNVYNELGFSLLKENKPSKHWYNVKTKVHITDNLLKQRGFDQLFNTNYGKGTSNEQLMLEHDFVEIYDCGQSTWVWSK